MFFHQGTTEQACALNGHSESTVSKFVAYYLQNSLNSIVSEPLLNGVAQREAGCVHRRVNYQYDSKVISATDGGSVECALVQQPKPKLRNVQLIRQNA